MYIQLSWFLFEHLCFRIYAKKRKTSAVWTQRSSNVTSSTVQIYTFLFYRIRTLLICWTETDVQIEYSIFIPQYEAACFPRFQEFILDQMNNLGVPTKCWCCNSRQQDNNANNNNILWLSGCSRLVSLNVVNCSVSIVCLYTCDIV